MLVHHESFRAAFERVRLNSMVRDQSSRASYGRCKHRGVKTSRDCYDKRNSVGVRVGEAKNTSPRA
jgi:hypothetical protein